MKKLLLSIGALAAVVAPVAAVVACGTNETKVKNNEGAEIAPKTEAVIPVVQVKGSLITDTAKVVPTPAEVAATKAAAAKAAAAKAAAAKAAEEKAKAEQAKEAAAQKVIQEQQAAQAAKLAAAQAAVAASMAQTSNPGVPPVPTGISGSGISGSSQPSIQTDEHGNAIPPLALTTDAKGNVVPPLKHKTEVPKEIIAPPEPGPAEATKSAAKNYEVPQLGADGKLIMPGETTPTVETPKYAVPQLGPDGKLIMPEGTAPAVETPKYAVPTLPATVSLDPQFESQRKTLETKIQVHNELPQEFVSRLNAEMASATKMEDLTRIDNVLTGYIDSHKSVSLKENERIGQWRSDILPKIMAAGEFDLMTQVGDIDDQAGIDSFLAAHPELV